MPVKIHFLKDIQPPEIDVCLGEIILNGFVERFEAPLGFWDIPHYEGQWSEGLKRIVHGAAKSCLITQMYDPATANFIVWWLLYRVGDQIVIQNQVLFLEQLPSAFDPFDPYRSIGERSSVTDEGDPVSEWIAKIEDLQERS